MPAREHSRDELSDIGEVVAPLNMRPLVNHDAIEFVRREILNERWRNRNNRGPTTNDGGSLDTVANHQFRGAPVVSQSGPVVKATFQRAGKSRERWRVRRTALIAVARRTAYTLSQTNHAAMIEVLNIGA